MTTQLRDYIMALHLNPHAPYPWQLLRDEKAATDARDSIKKWRESQRVHLVDLNKCPVCSGDADNGHDRGYPPSPYLCKRCSEESV